MSYENLKSKFSNSSHKNLILLISFNLIYIIFNILDISIIEFFINIVFIYTVYSIILYGVFKYEYIHFSFLNEENISNIYYISHNHINSSIDYIRQGVFIENYTVSIKIIVFLYIFQFIGSRFCFVGSLLSIIDVITLYHYIKYSKRCLDAKNTFIRVVKKLVLDKLPKFQEKK